MHHLTDRGEKAVDLLTKLAHGDLALVRVALTTHGEDDIEHVINYIRQNRRDSSRPPRVDMPLAGPAPKA
jgi:hypothetical protein